MQADIDSRLAPAVALRVFVLILERVSRQYQEYWTENGKAKKHVHG